MPVTSTDVVQAGTRAVALTGIDLPSPPPTRVYISGHSYVIVAPRVPLPPIANVVKAVLNWVGPAGRIAKNIWHVLMTGGTGSTSDPAFLQGVADEIMTAIGASSYAGAISSLWTLTGVKASDAGGTSSTANSTLPAYPGGVSGGSLPPQSALVLSWQVATSYRGGKPRTYLPGVPYTATTPAGSSTLDPTFCLGAANAANAVKAHIDAHPVMGSTLTLGTVSYHHAHTVRPTPLFYAFQTCRVHERVDSQRRRSGKEVSFPVVP